MSAGNLIRCDSSLFRLQIVKIIAQTFLCVFFMYIAQFSHLQCEISAIIKRPIILNYVSLAE